MDLVNYLIIPKGGNKHEMEKSNGNESCRRDAMPFS